MKNILFLGCSFSALYYHPDPRWSYTYKVMKDLGFDRMINLSVAGASPSTLNRILLSYINNPVYGWPDFVFAQFPYAYRNEYYLDHNEEPHMKDIVAWYEDFDKSCWHQDENVNLKDRTFDHLPWDQLKQEITCVARTRMRERLDVLQEQYRITDHSTIAVTNLQVGRASAKTFEQHHKNHLMLFAPWTQQSYNLHVEVGRFESICYKQGFKYAYIESDQRPSCLKNETVREKNPDAWDYFQLLCSKEHFIPDISVSNDSDDCVDVYKDGHPGQISHSTVATRLAPLIKEHL